MKGPKSMNNPTDRVTEHQDRVRQALPGVAPALAGYQVETCSGPRGCPNRAVVCGGLTEKIKELFPARNWKAFLQSLVPGPLKVHHEFRVSVSDCPNACSRPQIADIGLIGACPPVVTNEVCTQCHACAEACLEAAISFSGPAPCVAEALCLACGKCITACPTGALQTDVQGYRILLGGKLGRHPRLATSLPGIFAVEKIPAVIDMALDYYMHYCRAGERLGEILEKRGIEEISKGIIP